MTTIPVTLAAWIIQDGAARFPTNGTRVDYRVGFVPAQPNDLAEMCVTAIVRAEPIVRDRDTDETRSALLRFPTFTATAHALNDPLEGKVQIRGRLHVDYELAISHTGRLKGTATNPRLITEVRPPGAYQPAPSYELAPINAERVTFRDNATQEEFRGQSRAAVLPERWTRDTGILVDVTLD